ncbi:MAG: c-type cytochrome [Flavobacteriales bacterium]|nr:c-type cytochrome [Flavobacteriales bacterium]
MTVRWFILFVAVVLAGACAKEETSKPDADEPFIVNMPPGAAAVPVPETNALTKARVSLGKALFFDERLSLGNGLSCASCHHPSNAFSDTVALSAGAGGAFGLRNAPSLGNVAWQPALFYDGGVPTLEQQVLAPIHDELEMASNINTAAEQLRTVEPFASLSMKGYGRALDGFVITRALASYERTLVSGWSRFDRYFYQGDLNALTESERNGWEVFNSKQCGACHSGHNFTDYSYRNIGYGSDLEADPGRQRITLSPLDKGKFKVPTLRNIALTAPYLHDGSMATLLEVIDHFNSGGNSDANKDALLVPLELTEQDKLDLLAFLNSLTDSRSLDQVP